MMSVYSVHMCGHAPQPSCTVYIHVVRSHYVYIHVLVACTYTVVDITTVASLIRKQFIVLQPRLTDTRTHVHVLTGFG